MRKNLTLLKYFALYGELNIFLIAYFFYQNSPHLETSTQQRPDRRNRNLAQRTNTVPLLHLIEIKVKYSWCKLMININLVDVEYCSLKL